MEKENKRKSIVKSYQKTHIQHPKKPSNPKRKPWKEAQKESIKKYLVKGYKGPSVASKTSGESQDHGVSNNSYYDIFVKSKSEASPLGVRGG